MAISDFAHEKAYDISEIRRENMRRLAEYAGGVTHLANKLGKSQSQISQLIGVKSDSNINKKQKNIGNKIARQLETAFSKPMGWMDILHHHVDETITAYELMKKLAPHRAVPLIRWDSANYVHLLNEVALKGIYEQLIPVNPKLSEQSFALKIADVDAQHCERFKLPEHAMIVVDPNRPLYDGAYILLALPQQRLSVRQINRTGDEKYFLNTPLGNAQHAELELDASYAVICQIIVEFE